MIADTPSILKNLSAQLKFELRYELFSKYLHFHPFFKSLDRLSQTVIQDICTSALTTSLISPGDAAFRSGNTATAMYWVDRGTMRYSVEAESSELHLVRSGDWLSEAALWTTWYHLGRLEAISVCELILLDSCAFRISVRKFPVAISMVREYGQQFIDKLNDELDMGKAVRHWMSDFPLGCLNTEILATKNQHCPKLRLALLHQVFSQKGDLGLN